MKDLVEIIKNTTTNIRVKVNSNANDLSFPNIIFLKA